MTFSTIPNTLHQNLRVFTKHLLSPETFSRVSTKMPFALNAMLIEKLFNNLFSEQIMDGDFEFLNGRLLQIELLDAKLWVGLSFALQKVKCRHFNSIPCCSNVTLSLNTIDAIRLIQQEVDPDTLFFQRKLKVNGDTDLAHHVKNTIDTLDPQIIPSFLLTLINEYKIRAL
jgi:O2-independent ubiquinone biosynthesis accessory factor UbiT